MEINDSRDSLQAEARIDTTTRRDFVKTGATVASALALGVYLKPTMQSAQLAVIVSPSHTGGQRPGGRLPKPPKPRKPREKR